MKHLLLAAAAALATAAPAAAAVITSLPGGTVLTPPAINYIGGGPQTLAPGVTWSATGIDGYYGYTNTWGLVSNGGWTGTVAPYFGLNAETGTMTFAFAAPVSAVGGFLNYVPEYGPAVIAIYDAANTLIESHTLSIDTPGLDAGAFYGFTTPSASIAYFTLSDGYPVLRDLTVATAATETPEPASLALLGAGLLGLAAARRRRA